MKNFITSLLLVIFFTGCVTTRDKEWDVLPEYIDYNINQNTLVALYNAYNNDINNYYIYAKTSGTRIRR